jgi:hypothetical protein
VISPSEIPKSRWDITYDHSPDAGVRGQLLTVPPNLLVDAIGR